MLFEWSAGPGQIAAYRNLEVIFEVCHILSLLIMQCLILNDFIINPPSYLVLAPNPCPHWETKKCAPHSLNPHRTVQVARDAWGKTRKE